MRIGDWINVLAILLAPLVALRVSEYLQDRKERRQRKLSVFRTLMTTRATPLRLEHVQALNMIDIVFDSKREQDKAVRDAWKAYLDQLNSSATTPGWMERREDHFVDLMHAMSMAVGYDYDKTYIRRTSYFPTGHGKLEEHEARVREAVLALLEGKGSLPVTLMGTTTESATSRSSEPV